MEHTLNYFGNRSPLLPLPSSPFLLLNHCCLSNLELVGFDPGCLGYLKTTSWKLILPPPFPGVFFPAVPVTRIDRGF